MTLIKICGITCIEDAIECSRLGAHYLGFVFADSPRRADVMTVCHISRILGGDVKKVGVFTDESDDVLKIIDDCELDFAQLHGAQTERFAERIGADRVIRVARVRDERSLEELSNYNCARFYLLDTYIEGVPGGTGKTFDCNVISTALPPGKPIFLSGGLNPDNVEDAIKIVSPFAVDASSGLECEPGKKDLKKVKEFIENVRKTDIGA